MRSLTAEMGWDEHAEARGPEVMEIPGVALEILRAGLPEAIETAVARWTAWSTIFRHNRPTTLILAPGRLGRRDYLAHDEQLD